MCGIWCVWESYRQTDRHSVRHIFIIIIVSSSFICVADACQKSFRSGCGYRETVRHTHTAQHTAHTCDITHETLKVKYSLKICAYLIYDYHFIPLALFCRLISSFMYVWRRRLWRRYDTKPSNTTTSTMMMIMATCCVVTTDHRLDMFTNHNKFTNNNNNNNVTIIICLSVSVSVSVCFLLFLVSV